MFSENIYYKISRWLPFRDQLCLALTCKMNHSIITSGLSIDDRNAWSIKKYKIRISIEEIIKREDPQLLILQNSFRNFVDQKLLIIGMESEKLAFTISKFCNDKLVLCFALKHENIRLMKKASKGISPYLDLNLQIASFLVDKVVSERFYTECLKTKNDTLIRFVNGFRLFPDKFPKARRYDTPDGLDYLIISNQTKQTLKNLRKKLRNSNNVLFSSYFNYYSARELKYLFGNRNVEFMDHFLANAILRKESPTSTCYCEDCQNGLYDTERSHFNYDNSTKIFISEDEKYIKSKYIILSDGVLLPKKTWSFEEAKEFNDLYRKVFRSVIQNANQLIRFENNICVMKDEFPDIYTDDFILSRATTRPQYAKYVAEYLPESANNIDLRFLKMFRISDSILQSASDNILIEYILDDISRWTKYFDKIKSEENKKQIAKKVIDFYRTKQFPKDVSKFLELLKMYPELNNETFHLSIRIYPKFIEKILPEIEKFFEMKKYCEYNDN